MKHNRTFKTFICVTAQHRQMLDQVMDIFGIKPDYDLDIMKPDQTLYDIFSSVLMNIKKIYEQVSPDIVLVHGDTSTSAAAALAAYYQQIPVGHVEAGLRTNNKYSPFPEEINRQITSRIATFNFAPTSTARYNLLKENICDDNIIVTGNTVIDSLRIVVDKINKSDNIKSVIENQILSLGYDIKRLNGKRKLVLITGHRRENFGEGFQNICYAVKCLSDNFKSYDFLYPVHFNPNVRKYVIKTLSKPVNKNVFLIDPVDYLPFVYLMMRSYLILTDSGGIQEEAPDLGKPVIVMRDNTERPEALEAGTVVLTGTDKNRIIESVTRLVTDKQYYAEMSKRINPYGDGKASERIANYLVSKYTP